MSDSEKLEEEKKGGKADVILPEAENLNTKKGTVLATKRV